MAVGVAVKVMSGVGSMMKMSRVGAQYEMKLIPVRAYAMSDVSQTQEQATPAARSIIHRLVDERTLKQVHSEMKADHTPAKH